MKCKSLILGPAAALLVAPSGALAADAMMKDDMGPVTVCEAYGAGYFFSPGTETCLKISGHVRFHFESDSVDGGPSMDNAQADGENWDWKGELNIHANTETEAGVLASRIRLAATKATGTAMGSTDGQNADGATEFEIDWATMELAGFRIGRRDSFWTEYAFGYYSRYDGQYGGPGAGMLADYTFSGNGFSATFGVSESPADFDFHAGGSWSDGSLLLGVVWFDAQSGGKGGDGGNAWRVVGEYNMSFVAPGAKVRGWYGSDGGDTDIVGGSNWGVTGQVGLGDDLTLFAGYSQYEDETVTTAFVANDGAAAVAANVPDDASNFTIGLAWNPLPGLTIQPEYTVTEYEPLRRTVSGSEGTIHPIDSKNKILRDVNTFGVRITRSF